MYDMFISFIIAFIGDILIGSIAYLVYMGYNLSQEEDWLGVGISGLLIYLITVWNISLIYSLYCSMN